MKRNLSSAGLLICVFRTLIHAQALHAPYAPFTAQQAELGKQLAVRSLEVRRQITDLAAPAEPFKIVGNLYFVGNANGEVFLLTSPQGHIMLGAGAANSAEAVQKNIETLGFKMTDIKAILVNHNHGDQSGGAAYMKEKTGAPLMAGFGEIPYIEHGMFNPPAVPVAPAADAKGGGRGGSPAISSRPRRSGAIRWRRCQSRPVKRNRVLDSRAQPFLHDVRLHCPGRRPRLQSRGVLLLGVPRRSHPERLHH